MAHGILHLQEIYKKKGREFIDKLFDTYVTINEKLDGSSFSVEKNTVSKQVEFFKRNTVSPISLVDRTLVKYYENPIAHFNSLSEDVINKLPAGWRFGFEYFINEKPQEIVYDRVPKNHLVLSYIHVKNGAGKILRTIQEKEELDHWADLLQVERSPIIFQGVLSDDQKIKVLEFLDTPFDKLTEKFKTESFVKYIVSVLNPELKKTVLNEDLTKPIEGIVFRFGSGDDNVVLAKMVDPMFFEMARQKVSDKDKDSVMNDIFYITLIDLANFLESLNFNKFKPRGRSFEERYINFICLAFNELIKEKGDYYEGVDFNEPPFMKKKEFDINLDFIPDQVTKDHIMKNDSFKKLFKIMLASFRKRKKKANGAFTQDVIRQFNGTVDKINNHLSQGLKESEIPTFGEFLSVKGGRRMEEEEEEEIEKTPTFAEFKSKMDLLNKEEEDAEEKKVNEIKVKGKRVNIIVGRFQPFHNGHMEMVGEMHSANGLPTVLIIVHPGHNRSGMSPLEESTVTSMLNNIRSESNGKVIDYKIVKRGYINDIVEAMRPQYEPILWGVGTDRVNGYKMQLELNYKKGNEIKLNDKFQIMETKRTMSGTDVRKAIEEDRFIDFQNMVPRTVQSMYTILRKDIEKYKQPVKL